MMQTGFEFKTSEMPAIQVETINLIKNTMDKKKMKNQRKMKQKMQSGVQ